MHVPDGFVSGGINTATYVLSIAFSAAAAAKARRTLGDRQVPLLGVTAAFIFSAQMINFPIAAGTSGHFLGALLAALLLGPLNSVLIMALVLSIQALVFADGGVTALGTNIFNMGIVGGAGCYWIFVAMRSVLPRTREGYLGAAAAAAWCSVLLAALSCAFELGLSGTTPLKASLLAMGGVHAVIGLGEAIITASVLSLLLAARPDLVQTWKAPSEPIIGEEARA